MSIVFNYFRANRKQIVSDLMQRISAMDIPGSYRFENYGKLFSEIRNFFIENLDLAQYSSLQMGSPESTVL